MDQQQRNDIDNLQTDHISLSIDENNTLTSPLEISLLDDVIISGNNWIITDDYLLKGNLADEDSLYFSLSQNLLRFKNIYKIKVQFSAECSTNGILLESVGLSDGYTTNYEIVETTINNLSDVDVDCSLFGLESNDVNTLMNDDYFTIVLGFNGKSLNSSLKLTDVKLVVYFDELLQNEIDTIDNRLCEKYSQVGHKHKESDITDLKDYSQVGHTHTKSDISDFSHNHTKSDITDIDDILPIGIIIISNSNNSPSVGTWTTKPVLTGDFVDKATGIDKNPNWNNNGVNELLFKKKTVLEFDSLEDYVCNFMLDEAFEILVYVTPLDGTVRLGLISEDNKEYRIVDSELSKRLYKISRDELGNVTVRYSSDDGANWITPQSWEIEEDTLTTEDCRFRFYNWSQNTRSMSYHDFYINQRTGLYEHRRVS